MTADRSHTKWGHAPVNSELPHDDEVTLWIERLSGGDERAAQKLWDRYFDRLVRLARRKFERIGINRRAADEEDVALSALNSFYRHAVDGRFQLGDREELWKLLVTITVRKAYAEGKRQRAKKRGEGQVRGESIFIRPGGEPNGPGIGGVLGDEPTPELATMAAESCEELLGMLGDESQREVARLKLEGYTNEEIAERLGCVVRTVERKLNLIREKWGGVLDATDRADHPADDDAAEETH
jgi:RNA polymerase sigma factor (sigma-70 family)